jgi:hypothetical protein
MWRNADGYGCHDCHYFRDQFELWQQV